LNRASANAQDGISLIQAAEGALQETHAILQRMRELAVQAANDVNETEDRKAIQDEMNQLTKEVDRIAFTTEFNKKNVLDGSQSTGKYIRSVSGFNVSSLSIIASNNPDTSPIMNGFTSVAVTKAGEKLKMTYDFALDIAADADKVSNGTVQDGGAGTIHIRLSDDMMRAASLDPNDESAKDVFVAVNAGDTGTTIAGNVRETLEKKLGSDFIVTAAGSKLTIEHRYVGEYNTAFTLTAQGGALDSVADLTGTGTEGKDVEIEVNGSAAIFENESDFIYQDSVTTQGALRGRDSIGLLILGDGMGSLPSEQFRFKIDDATKLSGSVIGVADGNDLTLQVGANTGYTQTIKVSIQSLSSDTLGVSTLDVLNHGNAQNAIAAITSAITIVSDQRASLGAVQNRLEHTVANLDTVAENLQSAESRIRDVDMANETRCWRRPTLCRRMCSRSCDKA